MKNQNDVGSSDDDHPRFVPEKKLGQSDQEINWKKAREVMAQQAKKIEAFGKEESKNEFQKAAEKKALDALIQLLEAPNQSLRLEAAKLILIYTAKY